MVILRTRNKITDFFMILAWASPFKTLLLSMALSHVGAGRWSPALLFEPYIYIVPSDRKGVSATSQFIYIIFIFEGTIRGVCMSVF